MLNYLDFLHSRSKSSSFKSSATSSSSLTEANSAEARSESWIDKISAPEVFYKATPVSPKLTGAQRRKSYTAATSASLAIKMNNSGEVGCFSIGTFNI